ncbi:MAG: OmpA family protein [Bacteroidota bacterium]
MKKLLTFGICIAIAFCLQIQPSKAQLINTVVSITGRVIDEITRQPLGTTLEIFDQSGIRVNRAKSNIKDGYYFITGLKPGQTYIIRNLIDFNAETRYLNHRIEIAIPNTDKYSEFSHDIVLIPATKDLQIPLRVSPFAAGRSKLRSGAEKSLKHYLETLKENQRIKFEIVVFPDNNAQASENLTLTNQRAAALKEFFETNGIKSDRITTKGNNALDPLNPPPMGKASKGKKYKGTIYIVIKNS